MTESRDLTLLRTVCPTVRSVTLGSVLDLPEVMAGRPEVIADAGDLERVVRWTHVLESPKVQEHLRGGEIVLSTGVGWTQLDSFERYVNDLRQVAAAALLLELGTYLQSAPQELIAACRQMSFPLVILHKPVAFIAISEAIHRSLLAAQTEQLQAKQEITEHFAELMRIGAPLQTVLDQAAMMIQAPLVVEDSSFNVVFFSGPQLSQPRHFHRWQSRSRIEHAAGNPHRYTARIESHAQHFGTLICLPPAVHPAGVEHVLTLAAAAIGSNLLTRDGRAIWQRGARHELIQDLLRHRLGNTQLTTDKLGATGFTVTERTFVGITIQRQQRSLWKSAEAQTIHALGSQLNVDLIHAEDPRNPNKIIGLLSLPRSADVAAVLNQLATAIHTVVPGRPRLCFGSPVQDPEQISGSLREAIALCALNESGTDLSAQFATAHPLSMLVHQLHHEPAIQALPEKFLGVLLSSDSHRGTDYIQVLTAYLKHPTNRSRAAAESHLSRSVFYQRLAGIEKLLDCDLTDAQNIAILTVSLLVHRFNSSLGEDLCPSA